MHQTYRKGNVTFLFAHYAIVSTYKTRGDNFDCVLFFKKKVKVNVVLLTTHRLSEWVAAAAPEMGRPPAAAARAAGGPRRRSEGLGQSPRGKERHNRL